MQTSTFLKSAAPPPPQVAGAMGVTPTHAALTPADANGVMSATLHDPAARDFWLNNFDVATVISYEEFESKLLKQFNNGRAFDTDTSQAIRLNVV
jgi:hypothetical protein